MGGITPDRVLSYVKAARRGELENLQDLLSYILETDSHVRSVYETLLRNVVGAPLMFDEGPSADFLRESVSRLPNYEDAMMHIAHAHGVSITVLEKEWGRVAGTTRVVRMHPIDPRDVKFDADWVPMVRTHADGQRWVRVDEEPLRWLVHAPGSVGLRPQMAGILIPCVLPWVFKKFATVYSVQTLERFAQPLLVMMLNEGATEDTIDNALNSLEDITASSSGVISGDGKLEVINASSGQAGEAHRKYIREFEEQITKGILGSDLNVSVGTTGGNRALGESQAETTILPRVRSMADSIAETLAEQWFAHELELNAHRFGSLVPEVAKPFFELLQDDPPEVDQLTVDAGAVTVNELRQSRGLEAWEGEAGNRIVTPVAKTAPSFSKPEVAPPPLASSRSRRRTPRKARQMTLPLSQTSPTCERSRTQIESVPFD
jgi:phage gp29-like protein